MSEVVGLAAAVVVVVGLGGNLKIVSWYHWGRYCGSVGVVVVVEAAAAGVAVGEWGPDRDLQHCR